MKKPKIVGYVVANTYNGPLALEEANVLWCHTSVTLFKSKESAKAAIRRTLKYAKKSGYEHYEAWVGFYVKAVTRG
jgi:hypothetical protein